MQTLKTILALGYRIVEPSAAEITAFPDAVEAEVLEVSQRLRDPSPLDLQTLHKMQAIYPPDWLSSQPERAQLLGERLLKAGEPLLAYDVLTAGLQLSYKDVHLSKTDPPVLTYNVLAVGIKLSPKDVRLWQLLALALARSGVPERANDILGQLRRAGYRDGETLGLLARTHKDLWMLATEAREREHQLLQAHELYAIGYRTAVRRARLDDAIYDGINAATTALLLGEAERARRLARQVRRRCQKRLQFGADYWAQASLGEAAVILGEDTAAAEHYTKAATLGRGQLADQSSTRRTARWLADCLYGGPHRFDACFAIPRVVVFAGHMIDQPERPEPRFPAQLEPSIAKALAQRLETLQAGIGYASAACGADLLFLEAMQRRAGETHIVLPLPVEAFQRASVDIVPSAHWGRRFRRVLQHATSITVVNEHATVGSEVAYAYANFTQDGLVLLRARILETTLTPLVVWDGRQGDGPGGTASLVEHWRSQGRAPEIITLTPGAATSPPRPRRDVGKPATVAISASPVPTPGSPQEIKAMLFADVVGYSKLTEEGLPRFVTHFLGAVAELMAASPHAPLMQNTWGDALYFVFKSVEDAGLFALALRDRLCHISWTQYGLPADLILRIALHAGPVSACVEPVTQHPNYFGSHVSWAARIEPITPMARSTPASRSPP